MFSHWLRQKLFRFEDILRKWSLTFVIAPIRATWYFFWTSKQHFVHMTEKVPMLMLLMVLMMIIIALIVILMKIYEEKIQIFIMTFGYPPFSANFFLLIFW